MEFVEMATRIEASADMAWRFCGDFADLTLVSGFVERADISGTGIGTTRTYHLRESMGGGYVVERLERLDERDRIMEYAIVDNGSVPWTGYRGFIQVTPAGPNACMILIRTQFVPVDADAKTLSNISQANIGMYFQALRDAVNGAINS